jgi:uncharacterized membrane protein YcjF (UPF0283 family)
VKISYRTIFLTLLGVLIGTTVVTVIRGFGVGEFDWNQWLVFMAGGITGTLILLLIAWISKINGSKTKK